MQVPSKSDVIHGLLIGQPEEMTGATTRSYLSDGRCVGWYASVRDRVAIDAELVDRPVPTVLARRFGIEGFWARWTRAECAAKLSATPIVLWLREFGLDVPGDFRADFRTDPVGQLATNVIVTVAWRGCPCPDR